MKNEKKKQEKPKAQVSRTLTEDIKRRLTYIDRQIKNVNNELSILEKRKQKYTEGLPKVTAQLEKMNTKKKELAERREKEIKVVEELSKAFLPNGTVAVEK